MNKIKIKRIEETDEATIGKLYLNDKEIGYTLEPPWKDNKQRESCIPAGEYDAFIRTDSNRWDYDVIQLRNVPNRTAIQIHIGNFPKDTVGCILPGKGRGHNIVHQSRVAFEELMSGINEDERIIIKVVDNI